MVGTTIKYPLKHLDSEVGSVGLISATWENERENFKFKACLGNLMSLFSQNTK